MMVPGTLVLWNAGIVGPGWIATMITIAIVEPSGRALVTCFDTKQHIGRAAENAIESRSWSTIHLEEP